MMNFVLNPVLLCFLMGTATAQPTFVDGGSFIIHKFAGAIGRETLITRRNGSLVTCLVDFKYIGQGSVDTGNISDLILLDGNPLENIRNIRKVNTVIKGGQVYDRAAPHKMAGFQ